MMACKDVRTSWLDFWVLFDCHCSTAPDLGSAGERPSEERCSGASLDGFGWSKVDGKRRFTVTNHSRDEAPD